MSECRHAATECPEEDAEAQGEECESEPSTAPPASLENAPGSRLDMLFREAEVIARNLKESGTRR